MSILEVYHERGEYTGSVSREEVSILEVYDDRVEYTRSCMDESVEYTRSI